jgi:branched-chain amino acid transport system substrate-binding protein
MQEERNKNTDQTERSGGQMTRRTFLKMAGLAGATAAAGAGLGGLLAACGGEQTSTTAGGTGGTTAGETGAQTTVAAGAESGRKLKVGVVAPMTGALATFAVPVDWWVAHGTEAVKGGVACADGKTREIEVLVRDTQSDSNRAATVTADLIQVDNADLVLASGSPDTVNPSADQAEALGTPGLYNQSPWQAFTNGRSMPAEGFQWTYMHCIGSEQTMINFCEMYDQIPNNKTVGMLFANDADAAGWMDPSAAPKIFSDKGYKLVVPDYYTPGAEDFTAQISKFKKEGCDIICGTNNAAEFTNFWKQCYQQGFQPKLVSSGKCLIFPEAIQAMGDIGYGLLGEVNWHPKWPYKDSLTGMDGPALAAEYEAKTGHQWTGALKFYALFEWAIDIFKRAANPEDKQSIVDAIKTTKFTNIVGECDFTAPVDANGRHVSPNVVKAAYAAGQWVKGTKWPVELVLTSVAECPGAEIEAKVQPMTY